MSFTIAKSALLIACLLPVGIRAYRIHEAASFLESLGGDVWCAGRLYSGSRESLAPLSAGEMLLVRTDIICRILLGKETSVWICYLPKDRERFAQSLACLNSQTVSCEVIGPKGLRWLRKTCPDTAIRAVNGPKEDDSHTKAASTRKVESSSAGGTVEDKFEAAIAEIKKLEADEPELSYRLMRYETLIGYPDHGEMGRLCDKVTGRVFYLPWPNDE
jgi:hypothetical protein